MFEVCIKLIFFSWFSANTDYGCIYVRLINDKFCQDHANVPVCGYDSQDCCDPESNFEFCTECLCIEAGKQEIHCD